MTATWSKARGSGTARRGKRLIVYVRVSLIGDRGDDLISDDVQLDVCKRWAKREGMTIVDVVSDLDLSGREFTKRKITKVIERIRKGEADGVLVWKVSRWGRNLLDSLLNVGELHECGGFIASATENLDDIETPMGRFSLTQMLAIAQLQSDQIGETWVNIHDYRRGRGLPHTGGNRFGYDYAGKGEKDPAKAFTVNPVTGPWLAKCYHHVVAGQSVSSLCLELWENGIRSVKGGRITYRSLMNTLDSGFGAGLIVDRRGAKDRAGTPHAWAFLPGAHEPVITMDAWKAYLARRAEPRAPRERAAVHKLTGLLYCRTCKRKARIAWHGTGPRKRRAFQCTHRYTKASSTKVCPAPFSMTQKITERHVLDWLIAQTTDGDVALNTALARKAKAVRARADVEAMDKEIARLTKRLSRATDMALDEEDDSARLAFREKAAEIRQEILGLKQRRDELAVEADVSEIPAQSAFGAIIAAWEHMDLGIMNEALRKVIGRIEIAPGKHWETDRVTIIGRWEVE
jgi:site-specific DNA recombinase